MIPQHFITDLLNRVDIVDVVGRYVQLRKGGANLLGLCPFHGEKSPSFTVSPTKQFYHCFGCGAHGTAINFLMEFSGLSFPEAVRDLAQGAGMTVPQEDDGVSPQMAAQRKAETVALTDVLAKAAAYYKQQLRGSPRAIDYLKRRGLTGEIAARFGLGYAPDRWDALKGAFADYDQPELVSAGLVIHKPDEDKRYDRFRDRIMFPIRNARGDCIGFGGRIIDAGEPKYLNSPETPVFQKGSELYGLFEARQAIRERGYVLVVEGYMDVVALAQQGLGNAVATLGTACTATHVHKLLRQSDHVVFSFDGDAAGRKAAWRALEASLPHAADDKLLSFLFLPPEHDPDTYVREFGADAFEREVSAAMPLSAFLVRHLAEQTDVETAEGRAKLQHEAVPLLKLLPEGALRLQIIAAIAAAIQAEPQAVAAAAGVRMRRPADIDRGRAARSHAAPRAQVAELEHRLARHLLAEPELYCHLGEADQALLHEANPQLAVLTEAIAALYAGGSESPTYAELFPVLDAAEDAEYFRRLAADIASGDRPVGTVALTGIEEIACELRAGLLQLRIRRIRAEQDRLAAGSMTPEELERYRTLAAERAALEQSAAPS